MADNANQTTVIGADARFNGELTFEGTARILGVFEGRITTKGELQIAENATCRATIEAGQVNLDGTIEGDVTARERLELSSKARLKGNVVAARLSVAEGAVIVGHVTIGQESAAKAPLHGASASVEVKTPAADRPVINGYASQRQDSADFRAGNRTEAVIRR